MFAETDEQRVAHLPDIVDKGPTCAAASVEHGDSQPGGDVNDGQRIKTTDGNGTAAGRRPGRQPDDRRQTGATAETASATAGKNVHPATPAQAKRVSSTSVPSAGHVVG